MNDVEDLNRAEEEEKKAKALQLLKLHRFPQGNPGQVIERCGRKYLITQSGAQRRIKE